MELGRTFAAKTCAVIPLRLRSPIGRNRTESRSRKQGEFGMQRNSADQIERFRSKWIYWLMPRIAYVSRKIF